MGSRRKSRNYRRNRRSKTPEEVSDVRKAQRRLSPLPVAIAMVAIGLVVAWQFWPADETSSKKTGRVASRTSSPGASTSGQPLARHPGRPEPPPEAGATPPIPGGYGVPPPPATGNASLAPSGGDTRESGQKLPETVEDAKKEAIEVAERLIRDFPNQTEPIALMGMVQAQLGRTAEALEWWQRCLQLNPRRADAYLGMATVALRKGETEQALKLWEKALDVDPNIPLVHVRMAWALLSLGKTAEALEHASAELEISPRSSIANYMQGEAHRQSKRYKKAKESYLVAVGIDPNDRGAYYGLAFVCQRLGEAEQARQYGEEFRRLKTDGLRKLIDDDVAVDDVGTIRAILATALTRSAKVYAGHNETGRAEQYWRRAAAANLKNVDCRRQLASLYQKQGRNLEALLLCEQLGELNPQNALYHVNIGVLNVRLQRFDVALAALQRAMELEPDNADFRRMYETVKNRN